MSPRGSRAVAWALLGTTVAVSFAAFAILAATTDQPAPPNLFGPRGFSQALAIVFGAVGFMLASRRRDNPIGWILSVVAIVMAAQGLATEHAIATLTRDPADRLAAWSAWFVEWGWIPATGTLAVICLLFPDGRLLSPRWRWALSGTVAGIAVASVGNALVGDLTNHPIENPVPASWHVSADLAGASILLYLAGLVVGTVSLIARFRRASQLERLQIKWLALAAIGMSVSIGTFGGTAIVEGAIGGVVSVKISDWVEYLIITSFAAVPASIGIAILRYRLFDIDLVIRKTVTYAVLVSLIMVVALALLLVPSSVLAGFAGDATQVGPGAILGLIVGLSVWPLRRLAGRLADRLVFGGRATPYEVLAEFAHRVGSTYAAEDVLHRMAQVSGAALGAEAATVWVRVGDRSRAAATWPTGAAADPEPLPGSFDVHHQGELLGLISIRMPANDPMNPSKERLARDLARQAGPVMRNVVLLEDLRESRRRIVAAQDERARKLERDIHDGAQQQLVALAVKQRLVASLIGRDDDRARALIEELQAEIAGALDDLRDLARGIYPPVLADRGLAAAIEAQGRKAPVPVRVEADGLDRYPQDVEAAVYFCSMEALQNVAKYAAASNVTVELSGTNGTLTFRVSDDGVGFDLATASGSGLQGMADRIAAVGGTVAIRSTPGTGTTIEGRVPVGADR